jgi:hypothetical protein
MGPEVVKLVRDPVEVFPFETATGRLAQIVRISRDCERSRSSLSSGSAGR